MRILKRTALISLLITLSTLLPAGNFPEAPVRIIIPFTADSATDILARGLGRELSRLWNRDILFENLPGEGGTLAAEISSRAPADGHTLFIHGAFAINPSFYSDLPYDPVSDFSHIAPLARQPLALVVNPDSGINGLSTLIARAKARQGSLSYGSPGTGSAAHLTAEKFRLLTNLEVLHIPFGGGPETIRAVIEGKAAFAFLPLAFAKKAADSGRIRIIAVTSMQRAASLPDIPTLSEEGLAGFEYNHWWGLWAPAGIPEDIRERIEDDLRRALQSDEMQKLFKKIGAEAMYMSSTEFQKFVESEIISVTGIIRRSGIQ